MVFDISIRVRENREKVEKKRQVGREFSIEREI